MQRGIWSRGQGWRGAATMAWTTPAAVLAERADEGWEGIWTLVHAAARAALHLAEALPFVDGLGFVYAGTDLRGAQADLEWAVPGLAARCPAVDLGPVRNDEGTDRAQEVLGRLIDESLSRVEALADTDISVAEALTLIDVASALSCVRTRLDRRLS